MVPCTPRISPVLRPVPCTARISTVLPVRCPVLTVEVLGAAVVSLLILFTLLRGRLVVGEGGGEDAGAVLHQKPHHWEVVTRGRAVERGPDGGGGRSGQVR